MLKISVIITVYNTEKYLHECLDSIINQEYDQMEIIVIDDGSSDQCPAICEEYAAKDSRIRVIHQKNKGRTAARKAGLDAASGRYISFIDSDDYIDPDMYEKAVREINKHNFPDCAILGLKEIYPEKTIIKKSAIPEGYYSGEKLENLYSQILCGENFFEFGILPNTVVKIIKKEVLEKSGFFDISNTLWYGEDAASTIHLMSEIKNLLVMDFYPYNYRQNNYINGFNTISVSSDDLRELYTEMKKAALKYPQPEILTEQIKMYMYFVSLLRQYELTAAEYTDHLFPFEQIGRNADVVVYGAGQFGIAVYKYLDKSKFCNIVLWVDSSAGKGEKKSLPVDCPQKIRDKKFDFILIAVLNEKTAADILADLVEMGINKNKILFISKEMLKKYDIPKWLEV